MKIVCISDTHGQHKQLKVPDGDILIHCGDFTGRNSYAELPDFLHWLDSQPHKHKILIAGNHDWVCEKMPKMIKETINLFCKSVTYLDNEAAEIEGIKFYGSAVQPEFMNWAFNIPDDRRKIYWDQIPKNTDVLITHCPPNSILDWCDRDGHVGDRLLFDRICKLGNLKFNIFGHIHEGYGEYQGHVRFINCSVLNENYQLVNLPIIFEYKS